LTEQNQYNLRGIIYTFLSLSIKIFFEPLK
jgi:hypothetical protein